MIKSAKSTLVNHKLKIQGRQRNRLEPTRAACYRSKTPLDQDFLSLIFLFSFYFSFPIFFMVLAKILERKKRGKEEKEKRKNSWVPSVGNQGHLWPKPFFHLYLSYHQNFLHFSSLLAELREEEKREESFKTYLDLALI